MEPLKKKIKGLYKVSFSEREKNKMEEVDETPQHMILDVQKVLTKWLFADLKLLAVESPFDTRYMPGWHFDPEKLAYARVSRNDNDYKANLDGVPVRTDLRLPAHALACAYVGPVWRVAFAEWKQREVERATEAFHERAAKLGIRMCALGAYPILAPVPMSSVLDVVLSLHGRDLEQVRFVRFRKGDPNKHLLKALVRENGRYCRAYTTDTPEDCWARGYEMTMPRVEALEVWETSQAETIAGWLGGHVNKK